MRHTPPGRNVRNVRPIGSCSRGECMDKTTARPNQLKQHTEDGDTTEPARKTPDKGSQWYFYFSGFGPVHPSYTLLIKHRSDRQFD